MKNNIYIYMYVYIYTLLKTLWGHFGVTLGYFLNHFGIIFDTFDSFFQ